jgi:hypothetical protein
MRAAFQSESSLKVLQTRKSGMVSVAIFVAFRWGRLYGPRYFSATGSFEKSSQNCPINKQQRITNMHAHNFAFQNMNSSKEAMLNENAGKLARWSALWAFCRRLTRGGPGAEAEKPKLGNNQGWFSCLSLFRQRPEVATMRILSRMCGRSRVGSASIGDQQ